MRLDHGRDPTIESGLEVGKRLIQEDKSKRLKSDDQAGFFSANDSIRFLKFVLGEIPEQEFKLQEALSLCKPPLSQEREQALLLEEQKSKARDALVENFD